MKPILKLFNAVIITKKAKKKVPKKIFERTLKSGFVLSEEIIANYSDKELDKLITEIEKVVGLSGKQLNSSFHKSWKKVADSPIEVLILEQMVHYLTTYGFERLGIYDSSTVYIPEEELNIPQIKKPIYLALIKGYTKQELVKKTHDMLGSGIALKEDTLKDVLDVAVYLGFTEKDIGEVTNKEAKIALYDYLGLVPDAPVELLRYMVYKSTNKTLLIKNKATVETIKSKDNLAIAGIIDRYEKKHGLKRLAEIFYRFKPIFLAYKKSGKLSKQINKIRKLAKKYHKPMAEDYLNSVTGKIKTGKVNITRLKLELEKVNVFRKIRLANALSYRLQDANSILYKIRNGKGFATAFSFSEKKEAERIRKYVLKSIAKDIKPNVNGKKIFLPANIQYTLPATEKQFTGMFPSGSNVTLPKMVVGVYWENVSGNRIDLDLSLMGLSKFGWDAYYRGGDGGILFSGDMTDAKNGAAEAFRIEPKEDSTYLLMVNFFNHFEAPSVSFKIFVAVDSNFKANARHYMVDPNKVVAITETTIKSEQKQKVLGLISLSKKGEVKFYFSESDVGSSISVKKTKFTDQIREYMEAYHNGMIPMQEVLEEAGGKFTTKQDKCDIDLSNPEKDTFLNILRRKQ